MRPSFLLKKDISPRNQCRALPCLHQGSYWSSLEVKAEGTRSHQTANSRSHYPPAEPQVSTRGQQLPSFVAFPVTSQLRRAAQTPQSCHLHRTFSSLKVRNGGVSLCRNLGSRSDILGVGHPTCLSSSISHKKKKKRKGENHRLGPPRFSLLTAVPGCSLPTAERAARCPPEGHMHPMAVPHPQSPASQVHRPLLQGPNCHHSNLLPGTPDPR